VRPSINELYELDFVRKNIAKFVESEKVLKDFKTKLEVKELESSSIILSQNYPTNNSMMSNGSTNLKSTEDDSPKLNIYENYRLNKEKFNSHKKDILKKHCQHNSYNNNELHKIIDNLGISPIRLAKEDNGTANFEIALTPFDLKDSPSKETLDKKAEEVKKVEKKLPPTSKKIDTNKVPIMSKKGHTRQISFNISSSQSGINDSTSLNDSNSISPKKKNKADNIEEAIVKKFNSTNKKVSEILNMTTTTKNNTLMLNIDFLKSKIGREKYDFLIECMDKSENPFEFISCSDVAQKVCGKDHSIVAGMLKKILTTAVSNTSVVK